MGNHFDISLVAEEEELANEWIQQGFNHIKEIEYLLTTYSFLRLPKVLLISVMDRLTSVCGILMFIKMNYPTQKLLKKWFG